MTSGPRVIGLIGIIALSAGPALAQQAPAAKPPAPAVTVEKVERQNVRPSMDFTGRVKAVDKVELRARVTGFLEKRLFKEGDDVKEGQLLFQIEKQQYQATLDQQKAEVAKAQASVTNAVQQLARARELVKNQNIAQSTVDQRVSDEGTARADLLSAQANVRTAEINLGYTDIKSPIAGRIGLATFTVGNLVSSSSGVLATIVSQDPIYVTFAVAQRILTELQQRAIATGKQADAIVRIRLPDGSLYKHPGKIDFIDVQASQGTDTVTVRASVANPDRLLVDGQSVNITAERADPDLALVIPQNAIQIDQSGRYVLVVDKDNKVEVRRIKATPRKDGTAVVEEGLKEGEQFIVEGLLKVRPGVVVAPTVQPSTAIPKS
jgi:membrane fusion protein, multidrug efflux system